MKYFKNTILSLLLASVGLAAFLLSFDAQVTLAIAAGVDPARAGLYPLIVDAAIVTGVLIGLWHPELTDKLRRYLWSAIGFWTATSVLGNAFHVLALPTDRVQLPPLLAIAVNTIPALSLFLIIHLATTTAFATKPTTTSTRRSPSIQRPARTASEGSATTSKSARPDIPPTDELELLAMADRGMPLSAIAAEVNRSKSYVGAVVKRLRDQRSELSA